MRSEASKPLTLLWLVPTPVMVVRTGELHFGASRQRVAPRANDGHFDGGTTPPASVKRTALPWVPTRGLKKVLEKSPVWIASG